MDLHIDFLEPLEELLKMNQVLQEPLAMHQDVIYITLQEIYPFKNLVHDSLKEDRCIFQSKRHHKPFPQLVGSMECCNLAILLNKHNLVEALPKIHNCEDVLVFNVIKQLIKDGHGVRVLKCNHIQRPIIHAHLFLSH